MPEQPEELAQASDNQLNQPEILDHETAPNVRQSLESWQQIQNGQATQLGEGVVWRPGQSKANFWRRTSIMLAAAAAEEANENPDDPEAQERKKFWEEMRQRRWIDKKD